MMTMRAAALALLVGAANAQDDDRQVEGHGEGERCTPFADGARPCAADLICRDQWDNENSVWDGNHICWAADTVWPMSDPQPGSVGCSGDDPMMACAPTFWCNADGACESVLRDGGTPSPCDMCHGTCSDADDADACHRGCENTACAPTTASLEEDCPSQMAACAGDPSGQCQTALDDMLAAYATGARASPGTSDLFTDVALCMFTKGDPNCATETRDCFLDGDCLLQMHAMETAPPEPGNGLLEGETCFSRFDRLPLLANQKKYLLSAMMYCFIHENSGPCGASEHACWLDDGCRPLMWPEPPDCGHDDAACMAAWEADLETQINALPDSTLFRTMEACRNEHDDHSRDEEEGPPEW